MQLHYYSWNILDPGDVLPRIHGKGLKQRQKQDREAKAFLDRMLKYLHKRKMPMQYLGEEKENHMQRFLIRDGFLEVFLAPPTSITAYFTSKKDADAYLKHVKGFLSDDIDDPKISLLLDGVSVDSQENVLSEYDWRQIHKLSVKRGVTYTILAVIILAAMETLGKGIEEVFSIYFHIEVFPINPIILRVIIATILFVFFLDPLKDRLESYVEKIMG